MAVEPRTKKRGRTAGFDGIQPMLSNETLLKLVETATTLPAAEYTREKMLDYFDRFNLTEKSDLVIKEFDKLVDFAATGEPSSAGPWAGTPPPTRFERFQAQNAVKALNEVTEQQVLFEYAISDKTEMIRGYSSQGKPLGEQRSEVFDKLLNAWLAENRMVSKQGVVYEADENGVIKKDSEGQPKRADADRLRQMIADKQQGLSAFISRQNGKVELSIKSYPYQAPQAAQKATPEQESEQGISQP